MNRTGKDKRSEGEREERDSFPYTDGLGAMPSGWLFVTPCGRLRMNGCFVYPLHKMSLNKVFVVESPTKNIARGSYFHLQRERKKRWGEIYALIRLKSVSYYQNNSVVTTIHQKDENIGSRILTSAKTDKQVNTRGKHTCAPGHRQAHEPTVHIHTRQISALHHGSPIIIILILLILLILLLIILRVCCNL